MKRSRVFWLVLLVCLTGLAAPAAADRLCWSESAQKPTFDGQAYHITCAQELAWIAHTVNSGETDFAGERFVQTCDIDLSGKDWEPIGLYMPFRGSYDGNLYRISGMCVQLTFVPTEPQAAVGLFGYCSGGELTGILLQDAILSVTGGEVCVGGIAGACDGTRLSDCFAQVQIAAAGQGAQVGGIAGLLQNASLKNSFGDGTRYAALSGGSLYLGGLVGHAVDSVIGNCYTLPLVLQAQRTGDLPEDAVQYRGTIAGLCEGKAGVFSNNYGRDGSVLTALTGEVQTEGCATYAPYDAVLPLTPAQPLDTPHTLIEADSSRLLDVLNAGAALYGNGSVWQQSPAVRDGYPYFVQGERTVSFADVPVLQPGETVELTAQVTPADRVGALSFAVSDPETLQLQQTGDHTVSLTAAKPGIAMLAASDPEDPVCTAQLCVAVLQMPHIDFRTETLSADPGDQVSVNRPFSGLVSDGAGNLTRCLDARVETLYVRKVSAEHNYVSEPLTVSLPQRPAAPETPVFDPETERFLGFSEHMEYSTDRIVWHSADTLSATDTLLGQTVWFRIAATDDAFASHPTDGVTLPIRREAPAQPDVQIASTSFQFLPEDGVAYAVRPVGAQTALAISTERPDEDGRVRVSGLQSFSAYWFEACRPAAGQQPASAVSGALLLTGSDAGWIVPVYDYDAETVTLQYDAEALQLAYCLPEQETYLDADGAAIPLTELLDTNQALSLRWSRNSGEILQFPLLLPARPAAPEIHYNAAAGLTDGAISPMIEVRRADGTVGVGLGTEPEPMAVGVNRLRYAASSTAFAGVFAELTVQEPRSAPNPHALVVAASQNVLQVQNADSFPDYEYSLDGVVWTRGGAFGGLRSGKTYTLHVRLCAAGQEGPSAAAALSMTTAKAPSMTVPMVQKQNALLLV